MAAEHFAYLYLKELYAVAKRAMETNTPGADLIVAELAPLFEDQGPSNPTPPIP